MQNGFTALGRRASGYGGRDIVVYSPGQNVAGTEHDFYTKFIPNTREYRVHVFQGEIIRLQGKYLDFPEEHTNPYIKNHGQGFRFRTPDKQLRQNRLDDAIKAVEVLGLDFGAVDMIIGEDGNHYVLEINTAPSCAPMTARAYVEKFAAILGVDDPDWHWLEPGVENPPLRPLRRRRRLAYVG